MSDRGMKTIGQEASIVFSDGSTLPYPRYRESSNGFVRGPHNEQLGRGYDGTQEAQNAVVREIQAMLDRAARLGRTPLGCTTRSHRSKMPDTRVKPSGNDIYVRINAYWSDADPSCYDRITFNFDFVAGRYSSIEIETSPLRNLPWDDDDNDDLDGSRYGSSNFIDIDPATGEVKRYTQSGSSREIHRSFRPGGRACTTRQSAEYALNYFKDTLEVIKREYITWECDTDLEALEEYLSQLLDAGAAGKKIAPFGKQFADAMSAAGYHTTWHFNEQNGSFYLEMVLNEHTVQIKSGCEPAIICHFERDEARLHKLLRDRLENELVESLETHGDLRDQV